MADREADRGYIDEAEEALCGLIATGGDAAGGLQLVEAALDEVVEPVERAIRGHAQLAGLRIGITGATLRASVVFRTLSES